MPESVIDLERTRGILNAKTLQSPADRFELAFDQHFIATVQVAAIEHGAPEILPFGVALELFERGGELSDRTQQFGLDRLQLFKMIEFLLSQGLKLKLQHLSQLGRQLLRPGSLGG